MSAPERGLVLVVEDDPGLRYAYTRILEVAGYRTAQAGNGEECLRRARAERPDVVLLDVRLPDLSGVEVCRRLRQDAELASTSVIHISGELVSGDAQADGLEAGADGYLSKPIQARALVAHVEALIRVRRSERALRESNQRQAALVEELTVANRRLEEYNRLKAEFVANMSHELRTPLTAIIGFAQLARVKPELAARHESIERILRNSRHLLSLIDDVLDVSKIEAGRLLLNREHFDVAEVVQSAFGQLEALALQKGLAYRLHVRDALPLAFTDPVRLRQVVTNLLSNALKFTPRGFVEAELSAADDRAFRFEVRDSGVGIDEEALDFIFERFRQVDGSSTRAAGGAGLGLFIVRQIVELLGGRIEVTSQPNEGSTFAVTIPLLAPPEAAPAAPVAEEGIAPLLPELSTDGPGEGEPPLVLIIEDDIDAATILAETTRGAGYRVRVAVDGLNGLRLARTLLPAAILLDVMMPGMDGWRVLQSLRSNATTAGIPVIVCSIVDNRALGYRLGATDYLVKPVESERLLSALQSVDSRDAPHETHVLVVDDEHSVRQLLTTALRGAGFAVRSAATGEAGLRMAAQAPPRAVITDLMMPGMSGFEFIARLRAHPATARTPIVVITGRDMTPEDRRLLSGQIADVIRKGDLLLSDLEAHLQTTLHKLGVTPPNDYGTADRG